MVEVFKTDVGEEAEAMRLSSLLLRHFPETDIHFDLEDCDRILRMEAYEVSAEQVMGILKRSGYQCSVLEG